MSIRLRDAVDILSCILFCNGHNITFVAGRFEGFKLDRVGLEVDPRYRPMSEAEIFDD